MAIASALLWVCIILASYPDIQAAVYLEEASSKFAYLKGYDEIHHETDDKEYELCICLDSSDEERLGDFNVYLKRAKKSLCIDHHVTNTRYCQVNLVAADASSASEVLFEQLNLDNVDKNVAECLYTGIVHDTGVFKYSCTSAKTMEIAGFLMGKGVDFGSIIDNSFYKKTYVQNQIMGRAVLESVLFLDGKCIFSVVRKQDMDFYGVEASDLDGIVDQLRVTDGVEVAIFLHETENHVYKVSMRSNNLVNVSKVASYFGGGGHVRAAGCTMSGSVHDVINNLSAQIDKQIKEHEA